MSTVKITCTYTDDKKVILHLSEKECKDLFAALNDRKIYWNEAVTHGFWTNLSMIRYIQFHREEVALPCETVPTQDIPDLEVNCEAVG
jgi:hypothetical protein